MIPGVLDHAVRDVQVGSPSGARPAEDAQHVVLLQRDSLRLDDARERRAHPVRGAEQRDHGLVGRGPEGLRLPYLASNPSMTPQNRPDT